MLHLNSCRRDLHIAGQFLNVKIFTRIEADERRYGGKFGPKVKVRQFGVEKPYGTGSHELVGRAIDLKVGSHRAALKRCASRHMDSDCGEGRLQICGRHALALALYVDDRCFSGNFMRATKVSCGAADL